MTAVSAPPSASLAPASPAPVSGAPQPIAAAPSADTSGNGLPADFASMLKQLQSTLGADTTVVSGSREALNELDRGTQRTEEAAGPADIAALLGQINALVAPHGANPAGEISAPGKPNALDLPRPLRPELATAPNQTILSAPAGTAADLDTAEPKPDFLMPETPLVDQAPPRGADANPTRGPQAEKARLDVPTPMHSPNWSAEVGQRVVWMASNSVQEAQLSVNPPHLGPIEISLSLKDDNATARFFSPHAEVRELLEQAMPRLREMLAGAGVQLGQSDVGAQSQQAFQQFAGRQNNGAGPGQPSFRDEHPSLHAQNAVNQSVAVGRLHGNGLVDTFV